MVEMGVSDNLKRNILSSYTESLADVFYKPILSEATLYQRVSAYFTSEGLDLIIELRADQPTELVENITSNLQVENVSLLSHDGETRF